MEKKKYLLCVDSDGSVMDTMNTKHKKCFGPCLTQVWDFQGQEQQVMELWDQLNLYTQTRGVNRYLSLAMLLEEMAKRGIPVKGLEAFVAWTQNTRELSNASLESAIQETTLQKKGEDAECLKKALQWSKEVNRRISQLGREDRRVFEEAVSCLNEAWTKVDIAVVSSANPEALKEEWEEAGLADHVSRLLSQKDGTKAQCIGKLLQEGYDQKNVLMVGDAPGDARAAFANGVWFYPILAGRENESWKQLKEKVLDLLVSEKFGHKIQNELLNDFCRNLHIDFSRFIVKE